MNWNLNYLDKIADSLPNDEYAWMDKIPADISCNDDMYNYIRCRFRLREWISSLTSRNGEIQDVLDRVNLFIDEECSSSTFRLLPQPEWIRNDGNGLIYYEYMSKLIRVLQRWFPQARELIKGKDVMMIFMSMEHEDAKNLRIALYPQSTDVQRTSTFPYTDQFNEDKHEVSLRTLSEIAIHDEEGEEASSSQPNVFTQTYGQDLRQIFDQTSGNRVSTEILSQSQPSRRMKSYWRHKYKNQEIEIPNVFAETEHRRPCKYITEQQRKEAHIRSRKRYHDKSGRW